ncbi:uncharacterized protein BP5553_08935 [Venustampulla echinocandica]|uniref:Ornithine aminotransferase n=1 Tax=Venustampulla echinocandica TaxID=2656787 RepID=A0A370TDD2_9HELO|nr:uncharacterized protein BP5553_08935 [Venustampulla echinocandica]RDL32479.1 hypothetical protein BP5553_08935 [Venustampulla echinocandica]
MPHLQKQLKPLALSKQTQELVDLEHKYTAGGFRPMPAFFVEGKGAKLWDVDGKEYIDFIAMFSAVNTGHCNPKILAAVTEQMNKITLVNLATHNAGTGPLAERLCKRFGYDKVISATSGSEATDTAVKIARKWGIVKKGIPASEMLIFGVGDSFHGLTSGVWNLQNSSKKRADYGLDSNFQTNTNPSTGKVLRYGNIQDIEECLSEHHGRVAAVIMECLHGAIKTEIEIKYSRAAYDLCKKYNILFIADEVRQGAGKTGKFFGYQNLGHDVKPDLVAMGKSMGGGFYPCSYVIGTEDCMSLVGTGEMASTFGFTPLGVAATNATLDLIDEPGYMERGPKLGRWFQSEADKWKEEFPFIIEAVSCGTDMCLYIDEGNPRVTGRKIAALCNLKGLLVTSFINKVRMSPPLVITDEEMEKALGIIKEALDEVTEYDDVPGMVWTGPD